MGFCCNLEGGGYEPLPLAHIQGLENALKNISDTAQIPMELYDPDGALNSRYDPRTLGTN